MLKLVQRRVTKMVSGFKDKNHEMSLKQLEMFIAENRLILDGI